MSINLFIYLSIYNIYRYTLIEQITKIITTTKQLQLFLKKWQNFNCNSYENCFLKLKTLYLDGLKQEHIDMYKLLDCHLRFKTWYIYLYYWQ